MLARPDAGARGPGPQSRERVRAARPAAGGRARGGARPRDAALAPAGARPAAGRVRGRFRAPAGVGHVSAVSSGTAGLHLAIRAAGVEAGDEVVTTPVQLRRLGQLPALRERPADLLRHRPAHAEHLDAEAAAAAVTDRTTGLLPVHIFGYPADMPAFEALAADRALWIVEDTCEALGARHADGTAAGARGNLSVFGFYPNKQLTTGEGGTWSCPDADVKTRIDSERNQGRAPDMGWLDHDRLGFNYRLDDLSCALGLAQLERLDALLAGRAPRRPRSTGRRWRASRGSACPVPTRTATGAAGSSTWCSCRPRRRPRRHHPGAARARGRLQALPPGDPPDELLPRALRPPGRRVPDLRGRRPPLAGPALLPRAERGPGGAGGGGAAARCWGASRAA